MVFIKTFLKRKKPTTYFVILFRFIEFSRFTDFHRVFEDMDQGATEQLQRDDLSCIKNDRQLDLLYGCNDEEREVCVLSKM